MDYRFLLRNAESFLRNARRLMEEGEHNLCAFNVEQAIQLEEKANTIGNIEYAYIGSRYFPTEFFDVEVREMMEVADQVRRLVNECLDGYSEGDSQKRE